MEGGMVEGASTPPPPATQYPLEGSLEFARRAGVDEGVEAGVEVAQPEEGGEQRLRDPAATAQRVCQERVCEEGRTRKVC